MQLVRIGALEQEKPAILIEGKYFDVSNYVTDYNEAFFANSGLDKLVEIIANNDLYAVNNNF